MTFGQYAIVDAVKHVFDKEPSWYWLIKPATSGGELAVSRVLTTQRSKIDTLDGSRIDVLPTTLEVAMREVAVTFGGTNIPTSETDKTPILRESASVQDIEAVLASMPREMLIELWNAVGEAVPGWGPTKPRKPKEVEGEEAKN